jgi:hypothetical protein
MRLESVSPDTWRKLAREVHAQVFRHAYDPTWDRLDQALLLVDENRSVKGFATVREQDQHTAFLEWGGAMPKARFSMDAVRGWEQVLEWCRERYPRVKMFVENTNFPMLKLAIASEFKVIGLKCHEGRIYLEHTLAFPKENV